MHVDYSKLTPEVRELLQKVEQNSTDNRQLIALNGVSEFLKLLVDGITQLSSETLSDTEQVTDKLTEIRNTVADLQSAMPELPDYSSPIVEAVGKLKEDLTKAISKLEVAPVIEGPNVNVEAPAVDLRGVEKVIKQDLSKAFEKAIGAIPKTEVNVPETDLTGIEQRLSEMIEWLESIDTASRLKTPFPEQLKVTDLSGGDVGSVQYAMRITTSGTDTYIGEALPGTTDATAAWRIQKIDTDGNTTWKDGDAEFDNTATDLTAGSFS